MGAMLVRREPASASTVRHELIADLEARGVCADAVDVAALVASELVGNAVRHTTQDRDLDVHWSISADEVYFSVEDPSPVLPRPYVADSGATGGRGLMIIEALTSAWGFEPTPRGKRVWARVPLNTVA